MKLDDIKLEPLIETLRLEKVEDSIYFNSPIYKNRISNSRLGLLNPKQGGDPEKFFGGFKSSFNSSFSLGRTLPLILVIIFENWTKSVESEMSIPR